MREVHSPCNRVCRIDPVSGWCLGCRRTLDEIADWGMLSRDEKLALLGKLERRTIPRRESPAGRAELGRPG